MLKFARLWNHGQNYLPVNAKYNLDYKLIKEQIERLLVSVGNLLELEWPKSSTASTKEAFFVIAATAQVVANTFRTAGFLSVENPRDWRHRPQMALVVPNLARTILDALYTVIFLFEDLSARAEWFMCSGARELAEYLSRAKRDYGSNSDWLEYLSQAEPNLANLIAMIGKSEAEIRKTKWWPTPQQMRNQVRRSQTATFFGYLDDWYYREFSQISHLTLPGLIYTAGALRDRSKDDEKVVQLRGYQMMNVVILLTSFYSEIEAELKIGVSRDLKYVWEMLIKHYPFASEIYDRRAYSQRLS